MSRISTAKPSATIVLVVAAALAPSLGIPAAAGTNPAASTAGGGPGPASGPLDRGPAGASAARYPFVPGQVLVRFRPSIDKLPEVAYPEPNYVLHALAPSPQIVETFDQWALTKIQAPQAWSAITHAAGGQPPAVLLATVDTGIDRTHPDLAANVWQNAGEIADNGADDDGNGYADNTWGWGVLQRRQRPLRRGVRSLSFPRGYRVTFYQERPK